MGKISMLVAPVLSMAFCLGLSQLPSYCASDILASAERLYAAGEFDMAKQQVLQELALHPSSPEAHYLLGNIYLREGSNSDAIKHYSTAYNLAPTSSAGKYSQSALSRIAPVSLGADKDSQSLTQSSEIKKQVGKDQSTKPGSKDSAEPKEASPIGSAAHTADLTNHELALECDQRIKVYLDREEKSIARLKKELEEQLDLNDSYRRTQSDVHNDSDANRAARQLFAWKKKLVESECTKRCDEIRAYYRTKEDALRDSASAVDSGYDSKSKSVKLVPLGTNIYTRSYQTLSEPSSGSIPLQATPAKPISAK